MHVAYSNGDCYWSLTLELQPLSNRRAPIVAAATGISVAYALGTADCYKQLLDNCRLETVVVMVTCITDTPSGDSIT